MNRTLAILGIAALAGMTILYNAAFTVRQDRQAVVLRFGDPQRVIRDPGLNWKMPFVDNVVTYDRRELMRDIQHQEVTMQDQKSMLADTYVVYRIVDPLTFLRQWQTVENFELRLDAISGNILRGALAQMQFAAMLTPQRLDFNQRVTEAVRAETRGRRFESSFPDQEFFVDQGSGICIAEVLAHQPFGLFQFSIQTLAFKAKACDKPVVIFFSNSSIRYCSRQA